MTVAAFVHSLPHTLTFFGKPSNPVARAPYVGPARPHGPRAAWAALVVLVLAVGLPASVARAAPALPPDMPATPMPDILGCSKNQEAFLRVAWRHAHFFTWRAHKVLSHIAGRPAAERKALWNRDMSEATTSSSPRRWFGDFDPARAAFATEAFHKAHQRFLMRGEVVKGIRRLRCGSPIAPAQDEHTDVCPGTNPGADGPPSAYHAPVGTIVLCPAAWSHGSDPENDEHVDLAARRLVHELFHWLSVNGRYIVDRHADGVGGEEDKKYYGRDNATYLARNKPDWAVRNNDNYAYFARATGLAEPVFTALFMPKEPGPLGVFLPTASWQQLEKKWKQLAPQQYLASVSSYVVNGRRHFAGVWRVGAGSGALYLNDWPRFEETFKALRATQDLIDLETFETPAGRRFLGVWQRTPHGRPGQGGLLVGMGWDELVRQWKAQADRAQLIDVETWVQGGQRVYAGVWHPGGGASALLQVDDWSAFSKTYDELRPSHQLVDYQRFQDASGKPHHLGLWRAPSVNGRLERDLSLAALTALRNERANTQTLIGLEVSVPLAAEID